MRPESVTLLRDIVDAGDRIALYTRASSREAFLAEVQIRDAVHWNFSIIGEALGQLHKIDAATAEKITEWRRIIAFRNQLIHGYGVIRAEISWDIVAKKLPILMTEARNLIAPADKV